MSNPALIEASFQQPVPQRQIWWVVFWNSLLWTAGFSLTSGGFVGYFAQELGATSSLLGLILTAPELAGIAGIAAQPLLAQFGGYRSFWWVSSGLSRLMLLGFPLIAWLGMHGQLDNGGWWLLIVLVVVHAFQGLAAVGYYAWLADLTPRRQWGRFFAGRNLVIILVQMTVPVLGGFLRDTWRHELDDSARWGAYLVIFFVGWGLLTASMLPMLWLPGRSAPFPRLSQKPADRRWNKPSAALCWLMAHSWCLAAANGLTQVAFLKYQFGILKIGLSTYYLLIDVMLAIQFVTTLLAGLAPQRYRHKWPLFWGTLLAAHALLFWMISTPSHWQWLIVAYLCWGGFGAVNVAGPNLLLTLVPAGETATPLALFRQVAGWIAGLTGILGGYWLTELLASDDRRWTVFVGWSAYHILFLLSFVGRVLAAFLVLPIREPRPQEEDRDVVGSR